MALAVHLLCDGLLGGRWGLGGGGQKPGLWLQGRPQVGALDEEPTYDPTSRQMELFICYVMGCGKGWGGGKRQGFGFRVDLK